MKLKNLWPLLAAATFLGTATAKTIELTNVSYDPTRELYKDFNEAFAKHWKTKTGDTVEVKMTHGGSGKQARSVIDGLPADVVTLALAADVDAIVENARVIAPDWQKRLPNNSAPYTSTIVFLVRKGNPKHIKDWDDLVKMNVGVVTPNPQTSGGARWNYLAAWGYAKKKFGSDDKAREFIIKLYKNVPVLDTGARGAMTTFVQREIGDVLISWENEAYLAQKDFGADKFEIVYPSLSVLAEPSVAWVDKTVKRRGTEAVAKAYLEYLATPEGQEIIAKNFYRPRDQSVAAKYEKQFPKLELITVDAAFGGWAKAQKTHFGSGGIFEQIYEKK